MYSSKIDTVRTLCNLMIVVLHAAIVMAYARSTVLESGFWRVVTGPVAYMAMPTLFCISGYLTANRWTEVSFSAKMERRFWRLVVPYISWNIIYVAIYLLTAVVLPSSAAHVECWRLTTIGGVYAKIIHPLVEPCDVPLWYIRSLFYLFLLSPIVFMLIRKSIYVVALILAVWYGVTCVSTVHDFVDHLFPWYGVCAYIVGATLSLNDIDIASVQRMPMLILGGAALAIECVWLSYLGRVPPFVVDVCRVLEVPFLFGVGARLDSIVAKQPVWRILSESSFFIYASHFIVCSLVYHCFRSVVRLEFGQTATVGMFWYCLGGVSVIVLFRYVCGRISPKLLAVLEGRHQARRRNSASK